MLLNEFGGVADGNLSPLLLALRLREGGSWKGRGAHHPRTRCESACAAGGATAAEHPPLFLAACSSHHTGTVKMDRRSPAVSTPR